METTLYKVTFKDGREYRVFCANKAQKKRFWYSLIGTHTETPEVIINGIHTVKQWEQIISKEK